MLVICLFYIANDCESTTTKHLNRFLNIYFDSCSLWVVCALVSLCSPKKGLNMKSSCLISFKVAGISCLYHPNCLLFLFRKNVFKPWVSSKVCYYFSTYFMNTSFFLEFVSVVRYIYYDSKLNLILRTREQQKLGNLIYSKLNGFSLLVHLQFHLCVHKFLLSTLVWARWWCFHQMRQGSACWLSESQCVLWTISSLKIWVYSITKSSVPEFSLTNMFNYRFSIWVVTK